MGTNKQGFIYINEIAQDGVINHVEHQVGKNVSGYVEGIPKGSRVIVEVKAKKYITTVDSEGMWIVFIPKQEVNRWEDGFYNLKVTAIDEKNVSNILGHASKEFIVDATLPAIQFNEVGKGNVLLPNEPLVISGKIANADKLADGMLDGYDFELMLDGYKETYPVTIESDGSWTVTVNTPLPIGVYEQNFVLEGKSYISDNSIHIADQFIVATADVGLLMDPFTGDNILNSDEVKQEQILSGKAYGMKPGQILLIYINDVEEPYLARVGGNGTWKVSVPVADLANLDKGRVEISIQAFGVNSDNPFLSYEFAIQVTNDPSESFLTINPITDDGYLSAEQAEKPLVISGQAQNVAENEKVYITISDKDGDKLTLSTTVGKKGAWKITVEPAELAKLEWGEVTQYSVRAHVDEDNNQQPVADVEARFNTGPTEIPVSPDTDYLHINAFTGDNLLTQKEIKVDQKISGWTQNVSEDRAVKITLNGKVYSTKVQQDGTWSVDVPTAHLQALKGKKTIITAQVTSDAGNVLSNHVDVEINPYVSTIKINAIAGDDNISPDEAAAPLVISGITEDIAAGQWLTIIVSGKLSAAARVQKDGSWQVAISPEKVARLMGDDVQQFKLLAMFNEGKGVFNIVERDFSTGTIKSPAAKAVALKADSLSELSVDDLGLVAGQQKTAQSTGESLSAGGVEEQQDSVLQQALTSTEQGAWDLASRLDGDGQQLLQGNSELTAEQLPVITDTLHLQYI